MRWARTLLRRTYLRLTSRRSAVAEIVFLLALLVLSLVVPQEGDFNEAEFAAIVSRWPNAMGALKAIGLTDIYHSLWLLASSGLLFLGIFGGFLKRLENLPKELRVVCPKLTAEQLQRAAGHRAVTLPASATTPLQRFAVFLRRRGFYVATGDGERLRAVRHRASVLGSIVFHVGMLLMVVAVTLSVRTRFHGVAVIGEGETFRGTLGEYASVKPKNIRPADLPVMRFDVKKFDIKYDNADHLLDVAANVHELLPGGSTYPLRVNEPYKTSSTAVRLAEYGVAPVFVVRDPHVRLERKAAVRLVLFPPGVTDTFRFPDMEGAFTVRLYPDHFVDANGEHASHSRDIRNPLAVVQYRQSRDAPFIDEAEAGTGGFRRLGRYEIALADVLYWGRFELDRDQGKDLVYVSLLLSFFGMTWRLLLPRHRIDAVVASTPGGGDVLHVAAHSDYTREPFASKLALMLDQFEKEMSA